jgi:hypothetical protein
MESHPPRISPTHRLTHPTNPCVCTNLDAVEVVHVAAAAPRDRQPRVVGVARRVGLVLDAGLVEVVAADRARVGADLTVAVAVVGRFVCLFGMCIWECVCAVAAAEQVVCTAALPSVRLLTANIPPQSY